MFIPRWRRVGSGASPRSACIEVGNRAQSAEKPEPCPVMCVGSLRSRRFQQNVPTPNVVFYSSTSID